MSDRERIDSIAFFPKVKCNIPRALFNIHFLPTSLQLIQYSVNKKVSYRYKIYKKNVVEMLRLPYNKGKHVFFVLQLQQPLLGKNRSSYRRYDFVVLNFSCDEYSAVKLDTSQSIDADMFADDIDSDNEISGKTVDIFENMISKIFGKAVTLPAQNYDENNMAPALPCTFFNDNENYLYPLDNGFINIWKNCNRLQWVDVEKVKFVQSQGRCKTFDFSIYLTAEKKMQQFNDKSRVSNYIDCISLEFKAVDQTYYDGIYRYCKKHEICIMSDSHESSSESESKGTNSSSESYGEAKSNWRDLFRKTYKPPDPYMAQCQHERQNNTTTDDESEQKSSQNQSSSSRSIDTDSSSIIGVGKKSNVISDDSSSDSDSKIIRNKSQATRKKRRIMIISDSD